MHESSSSMQHNDKQEGKKTQYHMLDTAKNKSLKITTIHYLND